MTCLSRSCSFAASTFTRESEGRLFRQVDRWTFRKENPGRDQQALFVSMHKDAFFAG